MTKELDTIGKIADAYNVTPSVAATHYPMTPNRPAIPICPAPSVVKRTPAKPLSPDDAGLLLAELDRPGGYESERRDTRIRRANAAFTRALDNLRAIAQEPA